MSADLNLPGVYKLLVVGVLCFDMDVQPIIATTGKGVTT
jgi:hypothetical protein